MGGIQAKESSLFEVHSVRGGQLILRAAPGKAARSASSSLPVSRTGSVKSVSSLSDISLNRANVGSRTKLIGTNNRRKGLERSLSASLHGSRSALRVRNRCPLMEQSMDILEKILKWLTPRDLALLSLTSRTLNFVVRNYVGHQCDRYNLKVQVDDFFEQNKDILLPKEFALKDHLDVNPKPNLLMYSTGKHYLGNVIRVSFCDVHHFAHLDDEQCIKTEWDVALKRCMVVIQNPRTNIHMVHVFNNVMPGRYVIQLRLRLSDSSKFALLSCRNGDRSPPVSFSVSSVPWSKPCWSDDSSSDEESLVKRNNYNNSAVQLVEQLMSGKNWLRIWEHQHVVQSTPPFLENGLIKYDRDSDWFFLQLNEFTVMRTASLQVEFKAAQEYSWKRGMIWDFLELRQLPSMF